MSYRSTVRPAEPTVTVTPKQLVPFVETCFAIGRVPCAWGSYGVGKSHVVHQIGQRSERRVFEVRLAQMDGVDVRGLPFLSEGRTRWGDPSCFPPADYAGRCIVFLDEANRAQVSVMNAGFQLIDQRRVGDYTLPPGAVVVLACNRDGDGGGVNQMPAALANRLIHANVEPSVDDWCEWAAENDVAPAVIAYIKWSGNLNVPKPKERVSPTPRSWHIVSDVVKHGVADERLQLALVAGAVGHTEAVAFTSYARLYATMQDLDEIIADPEGAPVPPGVSEQYAVAAGLARRADDRNLGAIVRYLARLPRELATFSVKTAVARDRVLAQTPEYVAWKAANAQAAA